MLVDGDVKIDLCLEHGKSKVSLSSFWLRKFAIVMLLDGFSHVMLGFWFLGFLIGWTQMGMMSEVGLSLALGGPTSTPRK
jgi:hypothetical protein